MVLGDLADGGLLGGLAQLDVPLGVALQQPAAPVDAVIRAATANLVDRRYRQ